VYDRRRRIVPAAGPGNPRLAVDADWADDVAAGLLLPIPHRDAIRSVLETLRARR
jgi:hypothetical protein